MYFLSVVVFVLLRPCIIRGDDDLVKSTVEEAKMNEETEHPEDIEARRPRTKASVHPLTDIPPPGDFAQTRYHLASHVDLHWRAGDEVTILCHFNHRLAKAVNVTGLMGSLNSPVHFGYYLQNFSFDGEHHLAEAKEDLTLDYTFRLAETLDPGKWQVALTVYYSVGSMLFASTFFNETVTLSEPVSAFGSFSLFILLLFTMAAAYFVKEYILPGAGGSAATIGGATSDQGGTDNFAKKGASEKPTESVDDDESWTAHLDSPASIKPKRSSSKKSVKSPRKK
uniref:Signal sequence receptor subunit alpha n=1 Tax=Aureoumbra lagunensis TaxID=44058 RepID=A0A7S3NRL3_9STRA|mmetsp:Transcript_18888/g.28488  ORF Transcript_18888/g.28488 Transcript_18888/m.28488 type:complete len:282 (+) Transcript_18888:86-931(+)